MKKLFKKISLFVSMGIFAATAAYAVVQQPIAGGTGISNNNSNTLILGAPLNLTAGTSSAFSIITTTRASHPVPSMTGVQMFAIPSPQPGDMAFDTDTNILDFWTGSIWKAVSVPIGAATGDLSNTYPSPTVAKINGSPLGSTTPTSGNALVANGSQWQSTPIPTSITGTANQIIASSGTGAITLSLPQSIATTSTPQFSSESLINSSTPTLNFQKTSGGGSLGTIQHYDQNGVLFSRINDLLLASDTRSEWRFSATGPAGYEDYMSINGADDGVEIFKPLYLTVPLDGNSGGFGSVIFPDAGGIYYSDGAAGALLAGTATAGQFLKSGASAAPSWSSYTLPSTPGTAGKLIRSDGTNFTTSTATFASTYASGNLLFSDGVNNVIGLTTGSNGTVVTDVSGNPSISQTLPAEVQGNITSVGALAALTGSKVVMTDGSKNLTTSDSNNLTISTYAVTMGDGTNNFVMSTALGQYVQIGSLILVDIHLQWSSKGSASAGSQLRISLPATLGASDSRASFSVGYPSGVGYTGSTLTATASTTNSYVNLFGTTALGATTPVTVGQCLNSGELQLSGFFWKN